MAYGLILAGGIGNRMQSDIPKQFIEIGGKPIIVYTIEQFVAHKDISNIIVLVPKDWLEYTRKIIKEHVKSEKVYVTIGGKLRNDTIIKGIEFIEKEFGENDAIVVTHDAARPFISEEIISRNITSMNHYEACDTVVPATDTIVYSLDNCVIRDIPDRSHLYQGQTPQSFHMKTFKELYLSLSEEEKEKLTDAAKVFIMKGIEVGLVKGHSSNIKITYPFDVTLANAIINNR